MRRSALRDFSDHVADRRFERIEQHPSDENAALLCALADFFGAPRELVRERRLAAVARSRERFAQVTEEKTDVFFLNKAADERARCRGERVVGVSCACGSS